MDTTEFDMQKDRQIGPILRRKRLKCTSELKRLSPVYWYPALMKSRLDL